MFQGPTGNTLDEDPTMYDSDGGPTTSTPKQPWQKNPQGQSNRSSGLFYEDSDEDINFNSGRFNFGGVNNFFIHRWHSANIPYAPLRLVNDSGTHCWLTGYTKIHTLIFNDQVCHKCR